MIRRAFLAGAATLLLGVGACTGGTGVDTVGATHSGPVTEIKVAIAEMSKDHTAAFWNAFATVSFGLAVWAAPGR